ncbi:MAG TPA: DNA polymerase [Candidatus Paceibacterota bacterium]
MKKSSTNRTLVILDAHAIIHRAYHALPAFANSAGVPTGALYGLASMIMRIMEELKPDIIVAAYDLPKPTFRHLSYEGYKGGRAKIDDSLITQLISSREIFAAFGIPCLDAEGFEADDVIGTLVEQYKAAPDLSIVIASGDMDTLQLVEGKKVQVFTLKKGVTDTILYDEDAVVERYGFKPLQLVDYKGLRGDPSDNIIGVPGIGEKTATNIISVFGSIEGLYDALDKDESTLKDAGLTPRIIGILRDHKDDAFFSKTLATIRRDAPVVWALPETSFTENVKEEVIRELFAQYEFSSLIPRVKKLFLFEADAPLEDVDPGLLRRASIALWVLYSEQTNPTLPMILERTRKKTLAEAYASIVEELKKRNLYAVFEHIEEPLIPLIQQMEETGVMIDQEYFRTLAEKMKETLAGIEAKIRETAGATININSPKQLSELLFTTLGLKPKGKKKASGAFTTNAETLESLRDEHVVVTMILEYREIQKLLSTYVEALLGHVQEDSRVHATFLQHGTTTGRFSSANPNMQNIPIKAHGKDIRHGIIAGPGKVFIGSDYSQIELRALAILSRDERLIESFVRGDDVHTTVASFMFNVGASEVTADMRRAAKVVNFGILFGMGVTALQKNLGTTREKAQTFYTDYFAAFPAVTAYLESSKEAAKTLGYTTTLFGRRRYFPSINSGAPFLRAIAERMASNAPIQGTAADVIKIAIALVDADLKKGGLSDKAKLVLQVHDELVYEVESDVQDEVESVIRQAMTSVLDRSPIAVESSGVPLAVSVGRGARLDDLK